jgi:hypothetical protein
MAHKGKQVTRRSVLQMSGGTFAAAGAAAVSGPWSILRLYRHRVQDVRAESFFPYLGEKLVFSRSAGDQNAGATTAELKLANVSPHEGISRIESRISALDGKRRRESFSLLFEQNSGMPLGPGLRQLMHPQFEDFQLFLSPVGMPGRDGTIYLEAVFG